MSFNSSLPKSFIQNLETTLGKEALLLLNSLQENSPVSFRVNPEKQIDTTGLEKVSWSQYGYYLRERPVFTLDPLFHAGAYYVQEASSMFLEQVLKQSLDLSQPLKVLDLCGAPGGKSTHLASLISKESLLVSNEVIRSRAGILAENLVKWGYPNVVVTNNDPETFKQLPGFFDVIVVDAPCSGEGMFRKDPESVKEWSNEHVGLCSARQRRIVADVWDALTPGGVLVYSTCTYNRFENEDNLRWMTEELHAVPLTVDSRTFPGITGNQEESGLHFYPHKIKGEGFYIAALKKNDGKEFKPSKLRKTQLSPLSRPLESMVKPWIQASDRYNFLLFGERILAFPTLWRNELDQLSNHGALIRCGVDLAEIKAKNLLPAHALALSVLLNRNEFQKYEADLETAIRFLRKEEVFPTVQADYLLLCFQQIPIGWLKRAGNRYNNLYPKEWRIRMTVPENYSGKLPWLSTTP